jgi:FemAB-related protein (PEP-CTERM system-associated)
MLIEVTPEPPARWDAYVEGHPDATAYHRAAAVLIGRNAFGLRTVFLAASDGDGHVRGVLPLVEQSSLMFGRFLVSLPFVTYGGILADDDVVAGVLAARAAALGRERRASHVELRHAAPQPGIELPERLDKVSMVLALPADEEALAKGLGSKLRSQIRRAEREQPEVVWGGAELIPQFYQVFAAGMHQLGTPVYPRGFFGVVCAALGERCRLLVVRVAGRPQAVALLVDHGRRIEVPWAVATPEAKRNAVNMRLYWEMLRHAMAAGAGAFDFGRSSIDAGTYRFKAQWGAQPRQLHWHYAMKDQAPLPQLNHSNPKYTLAVKAWQRMPLWCANLIGPRIARHLP